MSSSLIPCPRCNQSISPVALACPHCGEPLAGVNVTPGGKLEMHPQVDANAGAFAWTVGISGLMAWTPCIGIGFAIFSLWAGLMVLTKSRWGAVLPIGWAIPLWFGVVSSSAVVALWVYLLFPR